MQPVERVWFADLLRGSPRDLAVVARLVVFAFAGMRAVAHVWLDGALATRPGVYCRYRPGMPYVSDAQRRKFHVMAGRGEISRSTVEEFDRASSGKRLPKRKKKSRLARWAEQAK